MRPLSTLVHARAGSGEPVVLIHGIGHRKEAWAPVFETLARDHEVIAVDLAGFGQSPPYPRGTAYGMENACRDLAANFELWGVAAPHVVGNSLGGALALELGARGLVSSVTALSPAGFFGRFDRYRALVPLGLLRLLANAPDAVLRAVANQPLGRRIVGSMLYAHPERMTAEATYGDSLAMKNATSFGGAARAGLTYRFDSPVEVPTTIAWGTKDRLLPYSQARIARDRLPDAHHVALPGAGHVPMIDVPETIIDLVTETVSRAVAEREDVA